MISFYKYKGCFRFLLGLKLIGVFIFFPFQIRADNPPTGIGPNICTVFSNSDAGPGSLRNLTSLAATNQSCNNVILFPSAMTIKLATSLEIKDIPSDGLHISGFDFSNMVPLNSVILDGASLASSLGEVFSLPYLLNANNSPVGVRKINSSSSCVVTVREPAETFIEDLTIVVKNDSKKALCDVQENSLLNPAGVYYDHFKTVKVLVADPPPPPPSGSPSSCGDMDQDGICDDDDLCDAGTPNAAQALQILAAQCPPNGPAEGTLFCNQTVDLDNDNRGNACDDDSDGDGILNTDEIAEGTNPLFDDSDNDGAKDGVDFCPSQAGSLVLKGCPPQFYCLTLDGEVEIISAPDSNQNGVNDHCEVLGETTSESPSGPLTKPTHTPNDGHSEDPNDPENQENDDVKEIPETHDQTPDGNPIESTGGSSTGNTTAPALPIALALDDTDNDGIKDSIDACPLELGEIDLQGCSSSTHCLTSEGAVELKTSNDGNEDGLNDSCQWKAITALSPQESPKDIPSPQPQPQENGAPSSSNTNDIPSDSSSGGASPVGGGGGGCSLIPD